ncbi:hypothetical protein AB0M86_46900 [Streptomyces sp. NPDC051639]|uniref:hypothetical protein n=1 Tax=unclassified Streptomyces TaxID=2593676 RepID=UPI002E33F833|nr:hypothetical protein [Streptomyces sp. NBC_01455]
MDTHPLQLFADGVARWLLLDWVSEANLLRRASTGFAAIQSSAHFPVKFFCSAS